MAFSRLLLALPVLALVFAVGCDEDDPPEALDASGLEERFACDDLTLVAASADGEHALLVGIDDGLVAEALASGSPVEARYELPDDRLTVRFVSGSNVYQGHCGHDTGVAWALDERSDAIAGGVAIRLTLGPDGSAGLGAPPSLGVRVEAELEDVLLADDGKPELYLEHARFHDLRVD